MYPSDLFDRSREWDDLERFVTSPTPGVRVGILSGRSRQGKSFLLRRLARAHRGLYQMALEEEPVPALQRFADGVATALGLPAGRLRFTDWDQALRAAIGMGATRPPDGGVGLVVIDELPYLLRHPLGRTIPSVLQALVDESRDDPAAPPRRVIVCGSAISVMSELLSGTKPLRGRADLDMMLRPFDYRMTADYYGVGDPQIAFRLHAVFGGTPGYRDLLGQASLASLADFDELLAVTALNPSHALFGEAGYLLREDPRITDRAIYHSILAAIAAGATTPSKVAAAIGRDERSLPHPLDVLTTAGFVVRADDLLLQRRPVLRLADPIQRFHKLITVPRLAAFEDRRTHDAWVDAQPTFHSQILGPHFEELAREWVRRYADTTTTGGPIGEVGSTVVNDPAGRARHHLDVAALAAGQRRQAKTPSLRLLGEAKSSQRVRGLADLTRLDRIRALLVARGVDAADARLLLFGRSGFDADLHTAAARPDVELVDLDRLWHGT